MALTVRRYRIFLIVAALSALSFYYLAGGHRPTIPQGFDLSHNPFHADHRDPSAGQPFEQRPKFADLIGTDTTVDSRPPSVPQPPTADGEKVVVPDVNAALPKKPNLISTEEDINYGSKGGKGKPKVFEKEGQRVDEIVQEQAGTPSRFTGDQHPIADKDVINLPASAPKALPKIQFPFTKESAVDKEDRIRKQNIIRKSFEHAWSGYKQFAMGHDELKPLSKAGVNQTQFMGWGATLVDTLDTLWIMDLKEEFDEAVKEVTKIDFTTSSSEKIPLFETVIRYLGGLISAYDLTAGKQPVLLHKAVELADVLMGAFDTPNRMPIPYYYWKGSKDAEIPLSHKNTVVAELGSLSMEFTRLAQLTKKNKYYDAVARITNALEKFQSETKMPGLWPLRLDASGCKDVTKPQTSTKAPAKTETGFKGHVKDPYDHDDLHNVPETKPQPPKQIKDPYDHTHEELLNGVEPAKKEVKQQETTETNRLPHKRDETDALSQERVLTNQARQIPGCDPQSLRHEPNARISFGIGGLADSVYEYMPKMYALLGGQNTQYRTMYDYAMKTVKDHLLFRPMIKEEKRSILFAARQEYNINEKDTERQKSMVWEATHLTCFAGGMFGLASKLFDNPKDLDIAKRLTDGCIWAYESTPAGIMPETFSMVPCGSQLSCPWDEKKWHRILDFGEPGRIESVDTWNKNQDAIYDETLSRSSSSTATKSKTFPELDADSDEDMTPRKPAATILKGGIKKEYDSGLHKRAPPVALDTRADASVKASTEPLEEDVDEDSEETKITSKQAASMFEDEDTESDPVKSKSKSDSLPLAKDDADDDEDIDEKPTKASVQSSKTGYYLSKDGFKRKTALSHEEYVTAKIEEERLPPGYTSIFDRSYKLRPEAIESVFIMWRLTGDKYWREKGWMMFESIQRATMTDFGNAAVVDVTSMLGANHDSMESFWLAETLKYFYLLFSDPDLISLDDYVLNTEAHPFKIPKEKSA